MTTRSQRLGLFVSAALVLAASAGADAASAASISGKESKGFIFRAGGGEANRLKVYTDRRGRLLFKDRRAPLVARGACKRLDKHWARCPRTGRYVRVRVGSRNDQVTVNARVLTRIRGGSGRDRILGGGRRDRVNGQHGNDNVRGRNGDDLLKGGRGKDFVTGGADDDGVWGNHGRDKLQGRSGDDYIHGGDDNDRLDGGSGEDRLKGGRGNDSFRDDRFLKDFPGIDAVSTFALAHNNRMGEFAETLRRQRANGIRVYRQVFSWETIETSPGKYDFSVTDRFMAGIARYRLRVLPVIFDAPPFHAESSDRPNEGIHGPPKSGAALGRFAAALAKRYGPNGTFWRWHTLTKYRKHSAIRSWQIWNEPNLRYYWGDRPNAKEYVNVLRATAKAIRKVDRNAEIVTAGMPQSSTKRAVPLKKYISQMYKAGLRKIADTVAVNAYARNTGDLRDRLEGVRGVMDKAGHKKGDIWVTEIGWASGGDKHRFRKGEKGQAREIMRAIALMAKRRNALGLRGFFYYRWQDVRPYRDDLDPGLWGFHAGLVEESGEAKKALSAYRNAIKRLP